MYRSSRIHRWVSMGELRMATTTKHERQLMQLQVDRGRLDEPATGGCCASVLCAPLAERDADELARAFAALGDPVRLRLLSLIADAGGCCSCDLEAPLGKAP